MLFWFEILVTTAVVTLAVLFLIRHFSGMFRSSVTGSPCADKGCGCSKKAGTPDSSGRVGDVAGSRTGGR